jgi:nicotinate-nucleotide adenylyltransferase
LDIGVFGGTFDPIHVGHLRAAEEVREALGLARVIFVPSKIPPHKSATEVTPPEVRLEMVRRAVSDNPFFDVSEVELRRDGPSYSIDTLLELRRLVGPSARLWFIVGADAFLEMHTWHRYTEIFRAADLAVMRRPPFVEELLLPSELAQVFTDHDQGFRHGFGGEVRIVPVTLLDISSTQIRQALAEGRSIRYLVPHSVWAYLETERHG